MCIILCGCYHGAWSADHFNVLDLGCGCRRGEAANDREKEQAVEECKQKGKMCIFSDDLDCFATCIAFPGIIIFLIYYFNSCNIIIIRSYTYPGC